MASASVAARPGRTRLQFVRGLRTRTSKGLPAAAAADPVAAAAVLTAAASVAASAAASVAAR